MSSESEYIKHIYWITKEEESCLRKRMTNGNIKIGSAKGVPCRPLKKKDVLSIVEPEEWDKVCVRQGSWYRTSRRNGLYLVISSFEVEGLGYRKEGVITLSDFIPAYYPDDEEKEEMIKDSEFLERLPPEWGDVEEREKKITLKIARQRFGSSVNEYSDLFMSHTANHSNFINPRFYVNENNGKIPYSIDQSAHLCSCCVELFQIIGEEFNKKLVSPCTGAVIYARLNADQYMLVEKTGSMT